MYSLIKCDKTCIFHYFFVIKDVRDNTEIGFANIF